LRATGGELYSRILSNFTSLLSVDCSGYVCANSKHHTDTIMISESKMTKKAISVLMLPERSIPETGTPINKLNVNCGPALFFIPSGSFQIENLNAGLTN
jgi:hypothetical protein